MRSPTAEQRTRMTRQRIRTAFLDLLYCKPIQSITIKELCASAGISRGTFYAHYADIYDLLAQIENDMTDEITRALEPLMDPAQPANPIALSTRIFEILKANSDLCTVTLGDFGDKKYAMRLIDLGRSTCMDLYRSYFRSVPGWQFDYYYAFVSSGVLGLLRKWLEDGMDVSPGEVARLAEGIMLRGVELFSGPDKP